MITFCKFTYNNKLPNTHIRDTALIKLLYDNNNDNNNNIEISSLLVDLNIIPAAQSHTYSEKATKQNISNYDKLMMHNAVHALVNINNELRYPMTTQIINCGSYHEYDDLVMLYVCGYKIVHNNTLHHTSNIVSAMVDIAINNGMCLNAVYLKKDDHKKYNNRYAHFLQNNHCDPSIPIYKSFAKTLRILSLSLQNTKIDFSSYRIIEDIDIKLCIYIENLNADENEKITTCEPFAKNLKILSARGSCGINNHGLRLCTNIVDLAADLNCNITTCTPFVNSLRILSAQANQITQHLSRPRTCGIDDDALKLCTFIEKLNVDGNKKITTCTPFAKSLRILSIHDTSKSFNDSLSLCENITNLNATYNFKIKSCASFAKSLRILNASDYCIISDNGIQLCRNIENLNANNNSKITTCEPFANSLRILRARYTCGITDNGLRCCMNIEELHVSDNPKITTCNPFARSLHSLHASGNRCGMSDNGLQKCASMIFIDAFDNDKITDGAKKRLVKGCGIQI